MARINLLPWREELRERKNKEFITLVIGICCSDWHCFCGLDIF